MIWFFYDRVLTAAYGDTVVKARRKRYSIPEKLSILKEVESMVASHKVLIERVLFTWVFEQDEMGITVNIVSILLKTAVLSRDFKVKRWLAQYSAIRRFVSKYGLVYPLGTRAFQRTREEVDEEATKWIEDVHKKLKQPQYSQDYILNMDQTAMYFSMHAKQTSSEQGLHTIFIRKAKDDSKRAMAAFTITTSGLQLQPCTVFKGLFSVVYLNLQLCILYYCIIIFSAQPNGRVEKVLLFCNPTAPRGPLYKCQSNVWMDERSMFMPVSSSTHF
jgi:hypothetical protein